MPCTYDPTPQEEAAAREAAVRRAETNASNAKKAQRVPKLEETNHALSVALDETSELLLQLWSDAHDVMEMPGGLDHLKDAVERVEKRQIKHRQDDIDRLVKVLSKAPRKNKDLLVKVLLADPSKPLEPQLGFNPDDY